MALIFAKQGEPKELKFPEAKAIQKTTKYTSPIYYHLDGENKGNWVDNDGYVMKTMNNSNYEKTDTGLLIRSVSKDDEGDYNVFPPVRVQVMRNGKAQYDHAPGHLIHLHVDD